MSKSTKKVLEGQCLSPQTPRHSYEASTTASPQIIDGRPSYYKNRGTSFVPPAFPS